MDEGVELPCGLKRKKTEAIERIPGLVWMGTPRERRSMDQRKVVQTLGTLNNSDTTIGKQGLAHHMR